MTHYVIVILMFVALGMDGPDKDALEISHKDGKPLLFDTFEQCVDHVNENIVELKQHASEQFDGAPVKKIMCFEKNGA